MLDASFRQLNTEFGFAFTLAPVPELKNFIADLDLIESSYSRYLGITQAWRLAQPGFAEQFRRMLLSRLRVVFENSASELEMWSKSATSQVEVQLRERRRGFSRRREALQRVQSATGDLEQRIGEVQGQEESLAALLARLEQLAGEAIQSARRVVNDKISSASTEQQDAA